MSSSTAGQWSPSPSPMRVTLLRASVPADARRGNQTSGTDKTRPSASWTISSSSVHRALTARGSTSTAEVLIPALLKELSILRDKARNSGQLLRRKPAAPREHDRCKPELRNRSIALHVNVRKLSILVRVEEKPIKTDDQNCRHTAMLHSPQRISCQIRRSKEDFFPVHLLERGQDIPTTSARSSCWATRSRSSASIGPTSRSSPSAARASEKPASPSSRSNLRICRRSRRGS